jgi:rhamnose utilization protein RhaD (predicted bifunctional aldolase and dehydrogenase)
MAEVTGRTELDDLTTLTRAIGDPGSDFVILAEGNTSVSVGDGTFWVKASGVQMAQAAQDDFVRLSVDPLLELLTGPALTDSELRQAVRDRVVEGSKRPSIEVLLHAICIGEFGASAAGHCHPLGANALLCSTRAEKLAAGVLFPDQAVICGPHVAYVKYSPPGIELARAVRTSMSEVRERTGKAPRTVWLENHGVLALGQSTGDVLAITRMADKFARILTGALSLGEPNWLDPGSVAELVAREDEVERARLIHNS